MSQPTLLRIALCVYALAVCTRWVHAQAAEPQGCEITDTSCPCLEVDSDKLCMQHEGNNKCLLGKCKPSYRCDCLGYEVCKRSSCSLYTTDTNTLPSETQPFGCHLTPDVGMCTKFDYVMDTVEGALNAHTDVDTANDEAMLLSMEAYRIVADIEADVIAMNDVLKTLEPIRSHMTLDESIEIEKEAETMMDLVVESGRLASVASQNAADVYKASREVTVLKHEALVAEDAARKAEGELKEKQNEADKNGKGCAECAALKTEFEEFKKVRKDAAKKAGEAAKNSRDKRRKAANHRQAVEDNRDKAKGAKDRLLAVVDKIKKRAAI